jgi:hypothetical protein
MDVRGWRSDDGHGSSFEVPLVVFLGHGERRRRDAILSAR